MNVWYHSYVSNTITEVFRSKCFTSKSVIKWQVTGERNSMVLVFFGMIHWKLDFYIINQLTLLCADLKPRGVVVNMIPGLPAHILFMCVRYADYLNDADMLKSFMNATIDGIKQVVKVGAMFDCTGLYLLIFNTKFTRCMHGTWGIPTLPFARRDW